ncbi:hypothetical protein HNQ92_000694 [Rhabdobacter roseus]|uniref:Sialate O-acetylesterase domain-containing protein n=1 Tax=Rhabdobacter roseus TaxID=1655419 RepID=A0A840TMX8_9BACT|nr:hypothetical protein [Rhabdobacter roseus]
MNLPTTNTVFQRSLQNEATVPVMGYLHLPYERIEARLVSLSTSAEPSWTTLAEYASTGNQDGSFRGTLSARGGWYRLEVRGIYNQQPRDTVVVARVGVGEVFLVSGNSNAMGVYGLGAKGATSEQVVSFDTLNKYLNVENITVAPDTPMPSPTFSTMTADSDVFPTGETPWYWGELGDSLVKRLGVPVCFLNASWAAANSINWREAAQGKNTNNIYVGKPWPNRQPYANLANSLRYYHSWLGIRAVLWSHGENDAVHLKLSQQEYFSNIKYLIEASRQALEYPMPWVIALSTVSYNADLPYAPVRSAQVQLAQTPGFQAWLGPDLDLIQKDRPNGHFENITNGEQGLTLAAQAWNTNLDARFFASQVPLVARSFLHTGVVPAAVAPGHTFLVPYYLAGGTSAAAPVQMELLTAEGEYVATVGTSSQNPVAVTIPAQVPDGSYRLRAVGQVPHRVGSVSEVFSINGQLAIPNLVRSLAAYPVQDRVMLHWLVATTPQSQRLTLQRSVDLTNYQELTTFTSTGGLPRLYSYVDDVPETQTTYYRVRVEQADGSTYYSRAVAVFRGDTPPFFSVFPNPVGTHEPIYLRPDVPTELSGQLFDILGRAIPAQLLESDVLGLWALYPQVPLSPGMYLLRVVQGTSQQTQRIWVK